MSSVLKELKNIQSLTDKAVKETNEVQKDAQEDIMKYFEKNKGEFISTLIENVADRVIERMEEEKTQTLAEEKRVKKENYLKRLKSQFI